jgi:choline dehydrogenase-like flavoprotein
MIHHLADVEKGYDIDADVVVVGSGAGGAVAAANMAASGRRVVVVEAGPQVRESQMTRDAPRFLARYFWDGGLRLLSGSGAVPCMQGRCLGGSTVSNSAIMYKLPDWVRQEWIEHDGLTSLRDEAFDRSFERIFAGTRTAPTPQNAQGPRNLIVRDALTAMGVPNNPLPRAVDGCKGCADCIVGCACGAKQSVDRSYIPLAVRDGAQVYTCSEVDRIDFEGDRAVGVSGRVVDPTGYRDVARFRVRAPMVIMAGGAIATPEILQKSGVRHRGQVGGTLFAHIAGGVVGIMRERMYPWIGASQGWGAIYDGIKGMKFESLWADPSVMLVKWGGFGVDFMQRLDEIERATVAAVVYRGRCTGSVRPSLFGGPPRMKLWIPKEEAQVVFRGMKLLADGLLRVGAEYCFAGVIPGVPEQMRNESDTQALLSTRLKAGNLPMTGNHIFGSVRMTGSDRTGPVAQDGSVHNTRGLYVCDASIFPSPSAVNPQATIMAMSDLLTRRLGELAA